MTTLPTNQSVERALALLELLDREPAGLGVREIARRLELTPSNIQRLVRTLMGLGYIEQTPTGSLYRLSFKAYFLGQSFVRKDRLHAASTPELERISSALGLTTYMAVRKGNLAVYLHFIQGVAHVSVRVAPGDEIYLHSTAVGKSLILDMSDDELRRLLGPGPLLQRTPLTLKTIDDLIADLRETRARGYSLVVEEDTYGIVSIGCPVRDHDGRIVAAISVALPLTSNLSERIESISPAVIEAARRISANIGYAA